ncbi:MAG: ABC transporter substrate-binding protein [Rhizobiaceae bacterium]|nr:MAG: ABC transporter substrate-binding protein [Rhizobiaceae bacterium]CAG1007001.1 hypothetical protein RHIZO_03321 [Rhizobiaceae bacterium]
MKLLRRVLLGAVLACGLAGASHADEIRLGHTINPAPVAIFMADRQGIFAEKGLDLRLEVMTADPVIPAALLSGSIEMGTVTVTTFLSAVGNGLDLVAFAGTSSTTTTSKDVALVVGTNSGIESPADFAGKTVGVPGIGALLDVMFREWLKMHGVDPASVTYIEVPFPQHAAQIQAGRIDAAITPAQFAATMVTEGHARIVAHPVTELPEGQQTVLVASTREWAAANGDRIAAFRAVVARAQEIGKTDEEAIRAGLSHGMKLPPEVAARAPLPHIDVSLSSAQLAFWRDALVSQGRIGDNIDLDTLVLP